MGDLLLAFYLFLPAGVANSVPPLLTKIFGPGRPIDGGRGIFGSHKTWQGFIGGTIAGVITFLMQRAFDDLDVPLLAGVLMSAGALGGDLVKSFFKRRMKIEPGRSWFPIDQLDYVIGAVLATAPVMSLSWHLALLTIVVYFVLHLIVSAIGFAIGVKDAVL